MGNAGGGGVTLEDTGSYTFGTLTPPTPKTYPGPHHGGTAWFSPGDGTGNGASAVSSGGGGAGAGADGGDASGSTAGDGGSGVQWAATGDWYGGGGGGGAYAAGGGIPGGGGMGGGADGHDGDVGTFAPDATPSTGGGGGGSARRHDGAAAGGKASLGGSGIVIVRYPITGTTTPQEFLGEIKVGETGIYLITIHLSGMEATSATIGLSMTATNWPTKEAIMSGPICSGSLAFEAPLAPGMVVQPHISATDYIESAWSAEITVDWRAPCLFIPAGEP